MVCFSLLVAILSLNEWLARACDRDSLGHRCRRRLIRECCATQRPERERERILGLPLLVEAENLAAVT